MSNKRIEMGLSQDTLDKIDVLVKAFGSNNKTDAVVEAVRLAYDIVIRVNDGARVELHKDGWVRELRIR